MPRYTVKVERTKIETTVIKVTAKDDEAAGIAALGIAGADDGSLEWELYDDTYDIEEVTEE